MIGVDSRLGRFSSFRSARSAPERAQLCVDVRLVVSTEAGGSDRAPVRGAPHRSLSGRRLADRHRRRPGRPGAGRGDSRQRRRARPSMDHRPVDRGLHPHFIRALGPRTDPRLARRCSRSACRPRFVDFGRGRRVGRRYCLRRSPTSPLSGAIRIGSRSIRPCSPPGSPEPASGS